MCCRSLIAAAITACRCADQFLLSPLRNLHSPVTRHPHTSHSIVRIEAFSPTGMVVHLSGLVNELYWTHCAVRALTSRSFPSSSEHLSSLYVKIVQLPYLRFSPHFLSCSSQLNIAAMNGKPSLNRWHLMTNG